MYRYIALGIFLLIFTNTAFSKVFLKRDHALKLAFPEADTIEKEQIFLSSDQVKVIESLSKTKVNSKFYVFYVAKKDLNIIGYALIDTHTLRSKTETVMFVIKPDGTLREAEILAFFEPMEYMPNDKWIDLFNDRMLDNSLEIGRNIPNITGATITSNSMTKAVRKVLAIYKVVFKEKNVVTEKDKS